LNKNLTNIFYQSFLHSNEAMILFSHKEFIACNYELAKILELDSIDDFKNINPFEIIPPLQKDGSISPIKFQEYLEICNQKNEITFDWTYKSIKEKEVFVEVNLKKITINKNDYFLATWLNKNELNRLIKELNSKNFELIRKSQYLDDIDKIVEKQNLSTNSFSETIFLLNEYKNAVDNSSIVSKADTNGKIIYVNDKFCEISGFEKDELIGKNHNIVRHPSMSKDFFKNLWETIKNKQIFKGIIVNKKKDGTSYYVDTTIVPILNKDNSIKEYIAIRHDVSQIYEKEKIIKEQYIDDLTRLPNRKKLILDIKDSKNASLVLIDISKFRDINEFFSYETGDEVLKEVSKTMEKLNIYGLVFYRLENDVFAILVLKNMLLDSFKNTLEYILDELENRVILVENNKFLLKYFFAVVDLKDNFNPLISAEFAINLAKNKKNKILYLNQHLDEYEKTKENKLIIEEIKRAILENDILIYGQKIVNNHTKEEKYETLMRLRKQNGEILSPYFFLEASKKAHLYLDLTKILVKKACSFFQDKNIEFSINLTLEDIKDSETIDFIFQTIILTNTASRVTFEIVESEAIDDFKLIFEFIQKAKNLKAKIAIDDFGTGYSNFEYVIKIDIDILKIDGSLIKEIATNKNIELAVKTINDFAKALNIKTVAEFVHNKDVYEKVCELGIDLSQGFYIHEPEFLI
jgi:PAS domain S-box-containing protein/diguanylate cyclase (GGDEF)-like protein